MEPKVLWDRLIQLGVQGLEETLAELSAGRVVHTPQTGSSSHARMLNKEDGRLDWSLPAQTLFNRFRGVSPWPGAYAFVSQEDHVSSSKMHT